MNFCKVSLSSFFNFVGRNGIFYPQLNKTIFYWGLFLFDCRGSQTPLYRREDGPPLDQSPAHLTNWATCLYIKMFNTVFWSFSSTCLITFIRGFSVLYRWRLVGQQCWGSLYWKVTFQPRLRSWALWIRASLNVDLLWSIQPSGPVSPSPRETPIPTHGHWFH